MSTPPSSPSSSPTVERRKTPPVVPSTPLGTRGTSHSKPLGTPAPIKDTTDSAQSSGPGVLDPMWKRGKQLVAAVTPGTERVESVREGFQSALDAVGGVFGFDPKTRRQEREDENEATEASTKTASDSVETEGLDPVETKSILKPQESLELQKSTWTNWNYVNPAYYLGWTK